MSETINWAQGEKNSILEGEDFYISYNPCAGHEAFTDLANLLGGDVKDGEETALYDGDTWMILEGDFRAEYEKVFPQGLAACKAVYKKHRRKHRSNWSTDLT